MQKENSRDLSSLFPYLNMELLSSERYAGSAPMLLPAQMSVSLSPQRPHLSLCACVRVRSFVVKHRVFLLRNWELVRDRQIRLRIESERDAEAKDADSQHPSSDGSSGDGSHIKSGP